MRNVNIHRHNENDHRPRKQSMPPNSCVQGLWQYGRHKHFISNSNGSNFKQWISFREVAFVTYNCWIACHFSLSGQTSKCWYMQYSFINFTKGHFKFTHSKIHGLIFTCRIYVHVIDAFSFTIYKYSLSMQWMYSTLLQHISHLCANVFYCC